MSNLGRVRSFLNNGGNIVQEGKHKAIFQDKNGYICVRISKDKKAKNQFVHRLVAEAFIPNPQNKHQVNHIDGDKTNNNVSNLEWSTPEENIQHAYKNGLNIPLRGEINPRSQKVKCINTGIIYSSIKEAQRKTGVYQASIGKCCKGERNYAGKHPTTGEKLIWEYYKPNEQVIKNYLGIRG
ncbi:HNH endonuclease [Terrisporobacter hibernicus]|uniref:HNH endonuclease n=1 Tax=Terrisporobacter hibernicus TaxID=2813371 RepID=A0AAX2ZNJ1_9FIRM|nr:HNH endonuclease [Terrisporobacter hibernicus]